MGKATETLEALQAPTRELRTHIPSVFEAYGSMSKAAMSDGALDAKTKELIALAISVVRQCDGCMASHARMAARRGATAEEVAEALGVAIMMSGGPGVCMPLGHSRTSWSSPGLPDLVGAIPLWRRAPIV